MSLWSHTVTGRNKPPSSGFFEALWSNGKIYVDLIWIPRHKIILQGNAKTEECAVSVFGINQTPWNVLSNKIDDSTLTDITIKDVLALWIEKRRDQTLEFFDKVSILASNGCHFGHCMIKRMSESIGYADFYKSHLFRIQALIVIEFKNRVLNVQAKNLLKRLY